MVETYHVNFAERIENALITTLVRAGVKMGTTSLLTVRGRKSGQPRTVPVLLTHPLCHNVRWNGVKHRGLDNDGIAMQ